MKLKQTLFFTLLVVGAVAYTVYDYSKIKYNDKNKEESVKLFPHHSTENLKEFKIVNNEKLIFLKKKGALWQLLAPIDYPADQEYVNRIIGFLDQPVEEISSLDDYNIFSQASVIIGFKFTGGAYRDILVSNEKTTDGRQYIQDIKTKKIYITSADWLYISTKSIFDFRWKSLFILKENIKRITFNSKYSFDYIHDLKIWQSPISKKKIFTDKKIAQFLSELMGMKVYRFVSEVKDSDLLKSYGLDKPVIKFEFEFKNSKITNWGLKVSKEFNGKYYATFINREQIFELNKGDVAKLKTYLNELN